MASRNYSYGLLPPTQGRDLVCEQIAGAAKYRNKLAEIELERRKQTDETVRKHVPGLLECEAELAEVNAAIEEQFASQRSKNAKARQRTDDSDCRNAVKELKSRRKTLAADRKRMRSEGFAAAACQSALSAVNDSAAAAVRAARAANGLYWGTYLLIEQAADSFRKGAPPVFRRFRGEGAVGVQFQCGITWEQAVGGTDSRIRIQHTPPPQERRSKSGKTLKAPSERRQAQYRTLWLRVGSDGRAPIWACWPLVLHRPIPGNARLKWATVQRRFVAGKERWKLILSVQADGFEKAVATDGVVGVDVGYRILPNGRMRVAYTHGSDGAGEELAISCGTVREFTKVRDLQSIRDCRHNDARTSLREWMGEHEHLVPEWLREQTKTMHTWRQISRLATLVRKWERFCGDEEIYQLLMSWRKKEQHLWTYQGNLRDQLLANRKNMYRVFSAKIRKRYRTICLEKIDLRELHDVIRAPEDREIQSPQRRAANMANLSTLVECLKESGCEIVWVDPKGTTYICHACGQACDWDQASHLRHTCEHCGEDWDQDDNAARNILARGQMAMKNGEPQRDNERKKPSRSERFIAARKRKSKCA